MTAIPPGVGRCIRVGSGALLLAAAAQLPAAGTGGIAPLAPYEEAEITQRQVPALADIVPEDPSLRRTWARALAYDATLFGTASVLQYRQMHAQAVDPGQAAYTGFNAFAHGRELAGPGYKPFKTPNTDTLYSNAWLDLSQGPVILDVPPTSGRYYTVNFLDMYADATNISTRTHGNEGGRYLIVPSGWDGAIPADVTPFYVATPFMWVLLRIVVDDDKADIQQATALQDLFQVLPVGKAFSGRYEPTQFPSPAGDDAVDFFRILDFIIRTNGFAESEEALVARYRGIGIAAERSFEKIVSDSAILDGLREGYADATKLLGSSRRQRTGWSGGWGYIRDVGRYGFNYLLRSSVNTLGTGSNVRDENAAFASFSDVAGAPLDGGTGRYLLRLRPPPARYFWSLTLYDGSTQELHPNPLRRYVINDRTKGIRRDADGTIPIYIQPDRPAGDAAQNWLPAPCGRFYLVIRAQGPSRELIEGAWTPAPVERVVNAAAGESCKR